MIGPRVGMHGMRSMDSTPLWTPDSVAGLQCWWDPSDSANDPSVDSDGGLPMIRRVRNMHAVGTRDLVNDAYDVDQDPTQAPATGTINGLRCMDFRTGPGWLDIKSGTSTFAADPLALGANPALSIFAIIALFSNVSGYYLQAASGATTIMGAHGGRDRTFLGSQLTDLGAYPGQYVANTPQIREVFRAAGASQPVRVWRNGTQKSAGTAASAGATTMEAVGCSSQLWTVTAWNGRIGEVLIYNTDVSAGDRALIEAYLSAKWGIALAP